MSPQAPSKPIVITSWIVQLPAAGILAMAGLMKITSDPGSI